MAGRDRDQRLGRESAAAHGLNLARDRQRRTVQQRPGKDQHEHIDPRPADLAMRLVGDERLSGIQAAGDLQPDEQAAAQQRRATVPITS